MRDLTIGLVAGLLITTAGVTYAQDTVIMNLCRDFVERSSRSERWAFVAGGVQVVRALQSAKTLPPPARRPPAYGLPYEAFFGAVVGECRNRPGAYVENIILYLFGYR